MKPTVFEPMTLREAAARAAPRRCARKTCARAARRSSPRWASRPCATRSGASPTSAPLGAIDFAPGRADFRRRRAAARRSPTPTRRMRLVFVNGRFDTTLSRTKGLPAGVHAGSLAGRAQGPPGRRPALLRAARRFRPRAASPPEHRVRAGRRVRPRARRGRRSRSRSTSCSSRAADVSQAMSHPRTLIVAGAGAQATVVESYIGAAGRDLLHQRRDRSGRRRERRRRSLQGPARIARGVPHRQPARAHVAQPRFSSHSFTLGGRLVRNDATALLDGEGGDCTLNGLYLADATAGRQPHDDRPRQAAQRQPRALQGHPRRHLARRLQRQDHRPPGRAEDRRQADEPDAAPVRRRHHQHQAAARDLRRRRQVHARRDDRPARRRGDLLPAGPRPAPTPTRATC